MLAHEGWLHWNEDFMYYMHCTSKVNLTEYIYTASLNGLHLIFFKAAAILFLHLQKVNLMEKKSHAQ